MIHHQMRPLVIEYRVLNVKGALMVEIPLTLDYQLRITTKRESAGTIHRDFFTFEREKPTKLENGRIKLGQQTMWVDARVELIPLGDGQYIDMGIKERTLPEVLENALVGLSDHDRIHVTTLPRKPRRMKKDPTTDEADSD